jgi:hypothetical protein
MDDVSFCWGFVAGFVVAGIAGLILQRIRLATKRAQAANSKQPVRGQTDLTPNEVVRNARNARLEMALWVLVIFIASACVIFMLAQGL